MNGKFTFIDLFCGIGGFHLALKSLGGECVFACDIDDKCRKTYFDNFGMEPSIDITNPEVKKRIPDHDVLCAGFPCQSFSKAGSRLGFGDTRGTLFNDIVEIIESKGNRKPNYLILENVRNLLGHDGGRTWKVIAANLKRLGYIFQDPPVIISPHQVGVPQFRERVVIIAQRNDLPFNNRMFLKGKLPEVSCNIEDILHKDDEGVDIRPYMLSEHECYIIDTWNEFIQGIEEPLPGFPIWADEFREEYEYANLPSWKQNFIVKNRAFYKRNRGFIDRWLKRHNDLNDIKPSRRKFEWQAQDSERDLWKLILQIRPSGIRVKKPTYFPGLVAITQTSIVGKYKRRLTPREVARLQSFPDDFKFIAEDKVTYRQLGNSLNVEIIKFMASRLLNIDYKFKNELLNNIPTQYHLPINPVL